MTRLFCNAADIGHWSDELVDVLCHLHAVSGRKKAVAFVAYTRSYAFASNLVVEYRPFIYLNQRRVEEGSVMSSRLEF